MNTEALINTMCKDLPMISNDEKSTLSQGMLDFFQFDDERKAALDKINSVLQKTGATVKDGGMGFCVPSELADRVPQLKEMTEVTPV